DRDAAARLLGSCPNLRRTAFATGLEFVFALLQRDAHTLGVGQGRTATTSRPTIRDHRYHASLVWIASQIRPDMIFGKDKGITLSQGEQPGSRQRETQRADKGPRL